MTPEHPNPDARHLGDSHGRARWLMHTVGEYLAGPGATTESRDAAARAALANGHRDFEAFVTSRCDPRSVVVIELQIERADGHTCRAAYRQTPGPLAFLVMCTTNCIDGDQVSLRFTTAQRGSVTVSEVWPFDLDTAERMTRPPETWMTPCAALGEEQSADSTGSA